MSNYNTTRIHICKLHNHIKVGLPQFFMDILGWPDEIYFDEAKRMIRPAGVLECGKKVRPIIEHLPAGGKYAPSYSFNYPPIYNDVEHYLGAWNYTADGDVITLTDKLN